MSGPGVSDATGRITVRRRHTRRQRFLVVTLTVVALLVAAGLGWVLLASDLLGVRTVQVTGNRLVASADVERAAAVPVGQPLARVDLAAIAERTSGLPPVALVSVAREWPNTITISVTERTPALAVETPGGYWIADAAGVIFSSAVDVPKGLLTARVRGADPRLIRDVATVVRALPKQVSTRLRVLTAETPDSIALLLSDGVRVVWGSAAQSDLKAQVLTALLRDRHRTYDVSAPGNPVVR